MIQILRTILTLSLVGVSTSLWAENPPRPTTQDHQHYVIVLSMDGFRHDLADHSNTPTLDSLARVGCYSEIYPVFPANTFPNHYTIATGLHPDHHGVVNNSFYDHKSHCYRSVFKAEDVRTPDFWAGDPIWNTAERQGKLANIFMWPGSDVPINGEQASSWMVYNSKPSYHERADWVIEAMTRPIDEIPNLVMWYFEQPDMAGHYFGPNSPEAIAQAERIDKALAYFFREIRRSPVYDRINFIVTADHGMTALSEERRENLYNLLDTTKVIRTVKGSPYGLEVHNSYKKEALRLIRQTGHISAWEREKVPARYHYGSRKDRLTNLILLPKMGWTIDYSPSPRPLRKKGSHGFDNFSRDMQMVFYATGPAFKQGHVQKSFQNVNLYQIICHLLDITPSPNDGEWRKVKKMFRE